LRIDDLDTPRVDPNAESAILRSLEAHGLYWDGPVARQSHHVASYREALARLDRDCFACRCTRRDLRGIPRYPGTCRELGLTRKGNAIRVRAEGSMAFTDRIQGRRRASEGVLDDFVVRRRDGFASYHLAVVIDDETMGVNQVVRGADLLDDTPRQLFLMQKLGIEPPIHAHLPVVAEASGVKLSKHTQATAILDRFAKQNVASALTLLGHEPPPEDIPAMLQWATRRWSLSRVPGGRTITGFVALAPRPASSR